jgi:hypothetical protein
MKLPRVAHVCDYATGRVFKEVCAVQESFALPTLFYRQCYHRDLLEEANTVTVWTNREQLADKLGKGNFDIVHVHTSISSDKLIDMVLSCGLKCKIVWDCHDLTENVPCMDSLHSVIVPSQGYKNTLKTDKCRVLYSKVPMSWCHAADVFRNDGKTVDAACLVSEVNTSTVWRDYREIQNKLPLPMFVFPANAHGWEDHANIMQRLPYFKVLSAMRKFKYGWAGEPNSKSEFSNIVTNKFWEYAAMGIKIGLWKNGEMANIAESMKWKITYMGEFRFYEPKRNHSVFMDDEINKLKEVYYA